MSQSTSARGTDRIVEPVEGWPAFVDRYRRRDLSLRKALRIIEPVDEPAAMPGPPWGDSRIQSWFDAGEALQYQLQFEEPPAFPLWERAWCWLRCCLLGAASVLRTTGCSPRRAKLAGTPR